MKAIRPLFFGMLLALMAADAARAQAVEGTVTSDDGPVPGANVRVEGTTHGAAADADGQYRIEGLAPGTYVLVASVVGFQPVRRELTLQAGETKRVDIALRTAVLVGEEVVVTGTMRERYVEDTPVKVEVVSGERLRHGAATSNLMDVIGRVNGLDRQLNCGVCYTDAIRINGVEGANTAVLLDGMPLMGALASVYGLNGISPMIIDRIEVVKGPQSTLYGTQALGGVVNVLTKDPALTPTFSAEAFGKSTHEASVDFAATPKGRQWSGFASGTLFHVDRFIDENDDGFADMPQMTRAAFFGKGTRAGTNGERRLDLAAKLYAEDRTGGVAAYSDALRGSSTVYGESIYTRRAELMADYRPAGLDERLRLSGAFTLHDQDSYYGTDRYDARQRIAFGQATWEPSLPAGRHLLVGAALRHETYDDDTPATMSGSDRRFIPGVFAQGEMGLGTGFDVLGGVRLDRHGEHGLITAPRLSAKYSPSKGTTVRLNGGTGFRVVHVFTEDHAALTGSREVVFAEDLDPERSYSATAGLQHVLPFGTNPLTVDLDGFYTYFTNKIIPDYDRDPSLIVYENLDGHSVTRGGAVGLSQNFTGWPLRYDIGFTWMDVYTTEGGVRTPVTYAPDFTGNLSVSYDVHAWDLTLDYALNLVGPKRMPQSYRAFGRSMESPTYATHDLKLTRHFADVNGPAGFAVEAYVAAENLLGYTQGSPLVAAEAPFSEAFDTVYTWGPLLGRTLALGARVTVR